MSNLPTIQGISESFGRGDLPAILFYMAEDMDWEYGRGNGDYDGRPGDGAPRVLPAPNEKAAAGAASSGQPRLEERLSSLHRWGTSGPP